MRLFQYPYKGIDEYPYKGVGEYPYMGVDKDPRVGYKKKDNGRYRMCSAMKSVPLYANQKEYD